MIDNDDGDDAATKDKMILLEVVNTSSWSSFKLLHLYFYIVINTWSSSSIYLYHLTPLILIESSPHHDFDSMIAVFIMRQSSSSIVSSSPFIYLTNMQIDLLDELVDPYTWLIYDHVSIILSPPYFIY